MSARHDNIAGSRDPAIDLIKTIAMVMVVVIHCSALLLHDLHPGFTWAVHSSGVIAVPLFFMASGYLLLGRPINKTTYRYAISKTWHIIRFILIFTLLVYTITRIFRIPQPTYPETLLQAWYGGGLFFVLWFMFALAILYLLTPLINKLWHHKTLYIIALSADIAAMGILWAFNLTHHFQSHIPSPLCLWLWLGYFMTGGFLRRVHINFRLAITTLPLLWIAALYLMSTTGRLLGTAFPEFHYGSPLTLLLCSSIFLSCTGANIRRSPALDLLSSLFLPVYVLHTFVIDILRSVTYWDMPGGAIWFSATTFICTAAISWLLMKIRLMRSLFSL